MGGGKGGRDMEKWRRDVAEMGLSRFEVMTSFLRSRHGRQWGRSRHGRQWGRSRHEILVSRPGNPTVGRNEVAT